MFSLLWARVLANAAPHAASNTCDQITDNRLTEQQECSHSNTQEGEVGQDLDTAYKHHIRGLVNRLRSQEFGEREVQSSKRAGYSEEYRFAACAAATHQAMRPPGGWELDSKAKQHRCATATAYQHSSTAGSLAATIALDEQL